MYFVSLLKMHLHTDNKNNEKNANNKAEKPDFSQLGPREQSHQRWSQV